MGYDSLYLNTHEAALAVIATAMKKSRLRIDTLVLNSILGGILFSSGGMLYIQVTGNQGLSETNVGLLHLLQGLVYPIGLFYVVVLGMELFNSNVLFFSAALIRGGVSIIDLCINWLVSWWFNLVGNIFVCYVFCKYTSISQEALFVESTLLVVKQKVACSFIETFLKGVVGNFYVSLAIYLQIMAKPLHVKLILMSLPVFTFVLLGFTHSVADMYLLTMGLINGAPESVGKVVWKTFLPGALGNIVGGSFFGIYFAWYAHVVVVERDRRKLNLPEYELRDEQPDLNMDSRVVRQSVELPMENIDEKLDESENRYAPEGIVNNSPSLCRMHTSTSRHSRISRLSSRSSYNTRSPRNVFPVYGMGPAMRRERSIASGTQIRLDDDDDDDDDLNVEDKGAEYLSSHIRNAINRGTSYLVSNKKNDIEAQNNRSMFPRKPAARGNNRMLGSQPFTFSTNTINPEIKDTEPDPKQKITHSSTDVDQNLSSYRGITDETSNAINDMGVLSEKSESSSTYNTLDNKNH